MGVIPSMGDGVSSGIDLSVFWGRSTRDESRKKSASSNYSSIDSDKKSKKISGDRQVRVTVNVQISEDISK